MAFKDFRVHVCLYIKFIHLFIHFNIKSFQFFQAIEFFLLFMETVATLKYPYSVLAMSWKLILQEKGGAMTLLEFCKDKKRREKHKLKTARGW